jgi:hypothetical protein
MAALIALSGEPRAQGFTTSDVRDHKHLDFGGKPCLVSKSESKPLGSDSHIISHQVTVNNHCSEAIKVQICYHGTDACKEADVPPGSRKTATIGVFPAMLQFHYDLKEQFDGVY